MSTISASLWELLVNIFCSFHHTSLRIYLDTSGIDFELNEKGGQVIIKKYDDRIRLIISDSSGLEGQAINIYGTASPELLAEVTETLKKSRDQDNLKFKIITKVAIV